MIKETELLHLMSHLIGDAAKNQLISNPENTVFDAKRLIGREWKDATVQGDI
jgi:molecular chaperone DnaK (HSP70)